MAVASMRGLSVFISDIRNCQNKEAERARVDKELANIRTHFKTDRTLTAYEKKKYAWKLLYIYMLGYEVEFGLVEATSLISASKYAEKQVGYVVTSCLLNESHDFLRLVINTVRNDIVSRNDTHQCLALTMVGNVGGKEFAEALAQDVEKLLLTPSVRPLVKKKAALCLLRLYRKSPELINPDAWSAKMVSLLEERDLGVLLCAVSLFITLLASNPDSYYACLPKCVRILDRLVRIIDIPQDYTYYGIPSPWLQVKVMRALQYFPAIEDPTMRKALLDLLTQILQKTDTVKNVNKNNATHGLLFEAMALAMHMDAGPDVLGQCVALLGKFIGVKEPNIRYLGLENMSRMLLVSDVQGRIKMHQEEIVASLKDPDISIRRRGLDLLYGMCDVENAKEIVEELLLYLTNAEYAIREELTLKTAVLAEKFAPNLKWYVDVILELVEKAGDFVSDDVWYRVVHIVTNNEDLQTYAAAKVLDHIKTPGTHETMVKIAGYILGEFGHLLATQPGSTITSSEVFSTLHEKFLAASISTKALLLSSYIKILLRAPSSDTELQAKALAVFTKYSSFVDAEVQQRAVEYSVMAYKGHSLADIMAEMPKFPERESSLLKKAEDTEGDAPEASAVKVRQQQLQSQALVPFAPKPQAQTPSQPSHGHTNGVTDGSPQAIPTPASAAAAPPVAAAASAEVRSPSLGARGIPSAASVGSSSTSPVTAPLSPAPLVSSPAPLTSPPATQQVGDLLGELLLLDAPPPTSGAGAAPFSESVIDQNPMALALVDGAPGGPAPAVQPIGSVEEWFKALMVKDSGVLYEDPYLQIGVKSEWNGPHGRVGLFLGNKGTAPLTGLQASIPPAPSLRLMLPPTPPVIPPRAQIQIPVDVAAVLAPRDVPSIHISYTTPAGLKVPLKLLLPVVISKFLQPASVQATDFFSRWKALAAPPLKLQEVLQGVKPLSTQAMGQLLGSLKISVMPNLDPNPNNLVACCTLSTETMPPVLLLIRIETDPADLSQMRLTVASPEPTATLSLKDYIKGHFLESGPNWLRPSPKQQGQQPPTAPLALPAPASVGMPPMNQNPLPHPTMQAVGGTIRPPGMAPVVYPGQQPQMVPQQMMMQQPMGGGMPQYSQQPQMMMGQPQQPGGVYVLPQGQAAMPTYIGQPQMQQAAGIHLQPQAPAYQGQQQYTGGPSQGLI